MTLTSYGQIALVCLGKPWPVDAVHMTLNARIADGVLDKMVLFWQLQGFPAISCFRMQCGFLYQNETRLQ